MADPNRRFIFGTTMTQIPFPLRYSLSRGQRLVPLLHLWGFASTPFVVALFVFFAAMTVKSAVALELAGVAGFGGLWLGVVILHRGLFNGLVDVLLVPVREMDIVVDANVAGVLIGGERWYLFLDGITRISKFRDDTWTVQHFNGCVLHIAASAIRDDQLAHLRAAMERGQTPEGIRAVIERGKRIAAIEESQRHP